jgi:hypothetical protein
MQDISGRTIDKSYRSFLGDEGVDWFINFSILLVDEKCDTVF